MRIAGEEFCVHQFECGYEQYLLSEPWWCVPCRQSLRFPAALLNEEGPAENFEKKCKPPQQPPLQSWSAQKIWNYFNVLDMVAGKVSTLSKEQSLHHISAQGRAWDLPNLRTLCQFRNQSSIGCLPQFWAQSSYGKQWSVDWWRKLNEATELLSTWVLEVRKKQCFHEIVRRFDSNLSGFWNCGRCLCDTSQRWCEMWLK